MANCETHGHIWGVNGGCLFCAARQEPTSTTLWSRPAIESMAAHLMVHPRSEPDASIGQQLLAQLGEIERLREDAARSENGRVILSGEVKRLRARVMELETAIASTDWPLKVFTPLPPAEAQGLREYGVDDSGDEEPDSRGPSA